MDDEWMPDQMDVLKIIMAYRKLYGPITDNSVENLADWIAGQLRDARDEARGE